MTIDHPMWDEPGKFVFECLKIVLLYELYILYDPTKVNVPLLNKTKTAYNNMTAVHTKT